MKTSTLIRALIAGGLIGLASVPSHAAGLGRLTVQSSLGQPLQAEIELLSVTASELDSLAARVASPEVFQEAKIQYSQALAAVRFSVERHPGGQPYLRLTTAQPVNEPFIDMLVELTWSSGRLVREFPVLLDPPGFAATKPAPAVATVAPATAKPAPTAPTTKQARPTAPSAAPAAEAGGDYKVAQGDTLYRIAGQVKPADVNLDQMVGALFRENRQAFMGDNMNRLKSGAILHVPTAEQANSVTAADATREIRAQAADWNAYRNKLAGQVAASSAQGDATSQSAAGKIGKATAEQPAAPVAAPKDVLKLSKNAEGKGEAGKTASAQERINALQEEATARENQVKEEKSRVAELEKNIQEMQKLLTLKNQGMAELQKKAESAKAEQSAAPPAPAKASESPAPAPAAETKAATFESRPAQTVQPVPSATPVPAASSSPAPAESKPAGEAKLKPAVKKPVVPPPPETSFVDELLENPLYQAAGAAILLLLGFLGYRTFKNRDTNAATSTGATSAMVSDLKSGVMGGGQANGVVDTGNSSFLTDFEKTGPGVIDIEEVDPVAEAEVYIAYGRDAQAEEILKEAMAKDSGRHEIPLKLLEIYAARKSVTSFEATARELHQSIGAGHPVWNRVADMGRKLDPANPLFAGGMAAAAPAISEAVPPAMEAPRMPVDTGPTHEELASHGDGLDLDLHVPEPQQAFTTASLDISPAAAGNSMDLSLDSSRVKSPARDNSDLDFDLGGLDLSAATSNRPEPPAAEQTLLARPRPAVQSNDDLDLSEFELVPGVTTHENVLSQGSFSTTPSAELKLPTLSLDDDRPIIPAAVDAASKRPAAGLDLGALNFDIPVASASMDSGSALNGDSEWHSVATKLDLARAYLEIGDKDGAREILQEVIQEGDPAQKREAETLTASLI